MLEIIETEWGDKYVVVAAPGQPVKVTHIGASGEDRLTAGDAILLSQALLKASDISMSAVVSTFKADTNDNLRLYTEEDR